MGTEPSAHRPQPTSSDGLTRRDLFRRGGAAAAGTAVALGGSSAIAPRYSPVGRAAAFAPTDVIGAYQKAKSTLYLVHDKAEDLILGDSRDYSGYTGADALHQEIETGAVEMQSADERVMTSIENNVTNSENVGLVKGKNAILEKMNAGASESDAQTAMQDAIDAYFATIEKNVLNHFKAQFQQFIHFFNQADSHANLDPANVVFGYQIPTDAYSGTASSSGSQDTVYVSSDNFNRRTVSRQLLDGTTYEIEIASNLDTRSNDGNREVHVSPWPELQDGSGGTIAPDYPDKHGTGVFAYDDGSEVDCLRPQRFWDAMNKIHAARDSVNGDLSGFVSDVYSTYSPGDIPTEDLVDPITASTELRQNYDNASGQSAHAAMLGIPTTADLSADLEIVSSEAEDGIWEVTADLFTDHVPTENVSGSASISSGVLTLSKEPVAESEYELTTADSETVTFLGSSLTDNGDGTWQIDLSADLSTTSTSVSSLLEEVGFKAGNTYQPSNWSDPFFIAYNYVDEATGEERGAFTQIESEFTIVSVTDSNGNSVDSFRPESRNNQTADVSALMDELEQLRKEQIRLQEEAQQQDGGGGGGLIDFDGGAGGPILGAVAVLAVMVGIGQATS